MHLPSWCLLSYCVAVSGEMVQQHFTAVCPVDSVIASQVPVQEITGVRSELECGSVCVQTSCRAFQVTRTENQTTCQFFQWTETLECEASTKKSRAYEVRCPLPFHLEASTRSCYYVHLTPTDEHHTALTVCQQHHGAHLVSVESQEEQSALETLLAPHENICGDKWWLGGEPSGADTSDKSSWFWNISGDLRAMVYDHWGHTEPHAAEPYMMVASGWGYVWANVADGFAPGCPVCEYEL